MRRGALRAAAVAVSLASLASAQQTADGPYRVLRTAKVGGAGGFDYVYADTAGRRLYIPRTGEGGRITVFNTDTLERVGEIPNTNARGVAVDPKSGHGFSSSRPIAMWDAKTLAPKMSNKGIHPLLDMSKLRTNTIGINTLVVDLTTDRGTEQVVAIVPVSGQLSLRELAVALGGKRAEMCPTDVAQRVRGFAKGGLELAACGNTMRAQNVTLKDLLPGFITAERGGVVRIAELQAQGYAYLRP